MRRARGQTAAWRTLFRFYFDKMAMARDRETRTCALVDQRGGQVRVVQGLGEDERVSLLTLLEEVKDWAHSKCNAGMWKWDNRRCGSGAERTSDEGIAICGHYAHCGVERMSSREDVPYGGVTRGRVALASR